MVYAVWAGHAAKLSSSTLALFRASYEWGKDKLEEIVASEANPRNVSEELARHYLTSHIQYELDTRARSGMREFERLAALYQLI